MQQNSHAYFTKKKRFNYSGKNIEFPKTKTTDYRVWCYEVLQKELLKLSNHDNEKVESLFQNVGGLSALTTEKTINSGMDKKYVLPITPNTQNKRKTDIGILLTGQPRN